MKKLLCFVFVVTAVLHVHSAAVPADDILAFVRAKLPDEPVKLSGTLKVKTKNGFTKSSIPAVMELDWGADAPAATYRIGEESLTITWQDGIPSYAFSNPKNKPTSDILGSGVTWADLSFSVLWWPGSKLIDEGKKINRDCYIVDVPVPGSADTMRLWIEKNMGMLLEARTRDAKGKELSCMNIVSIKKMDGMWVAKDLKIEDRKTGSTTVLQISDLEWKNGPPVPDDTTAEAFDPAQSVNSLARDLYDRLTAETEGNLFLSPCSISTALAMTCGGARGETADQMNAVLHFGGPEATHPAFSHLRTVLNSVQEAGQVELRTANALWPQKEYSFLPEYLALTKEYYGSEVSSIDYKADPEAARLRINTWVEDQTNGRIQDLIAEGVLDARTRLVLANAIYFKGNWALQFNKDATRPAPFKLADGITVEVPMMSETGDFKFARTETLQAIELPYAGNAVSMIVLLPNPGASPQLPALSDLAFHEMDIMVQIPKFRLESSFSLANVLGELGMPAAFSNRADFSGMTGARDLFIGAVLHKAFIEVNEEGTEAAAATGVVMSRTSMPPQFVADHPFLFVIRENTTGTILFIGRVMDPRS